MPSSAPLILAFDTSGPYCGAALLRGADVLRSVHEPMKRGQAERLMPLLQDILTATHSHWSDLAAIGVGVGPGNFTGIRIAVSAARGLALGLGIPAVGVSTFQAISLACSGPHVAAVPAPRDQLYVLPQGAADPRMVSAPFDTDMPVHLPPPPDQLAIDIARCAAGRYQNAPSRPAPLYIKPADAAPPRDPAPVILE